MCCDTLWSVRDTHMTVRSLYVCVCVWQWVNDGHSLCWCVRVHSFPQSTFSDPKIPLCPLPGLSFSLFLFILSYLFLHLSLIPPPALSIFFLPPFPCLSSPLSFTIFTLPKKAGICLCGLKLSISGEFWVQHSWNQSVLDYREARVISPSWIYWEKQKLPVKCCTDLEINATC